MRNCSARTCGQSDFRLRRDTQREAIPPASCAARLSTPAPNKENQTAMKIFPAHKPSRLEARPRRCGPRRASRRSSQSPRSRARDAQGRKGSKEPLAGLASLRGAFPGCLRKSLPDACVACAAGHGLIQTHWLARPTSFFSASALSIFDTLARPFPLSASSIHPFTTKYFFRFSRVTA